MRADSILRSTAFARFGRASCGALLLVVGGNALSLPGQRFVGRYDFGYAMLGDRSARPAQVFDDGAGKVFFETRPNQAMPAVFAGTEPALLVLQPEGQYFTARTTANEFTLVLGGARARVRRGDPALGEETVTPRHDGWRLVATAQGGLTAGVDYGAASTSATHEQPVVFAQGNARLKPEVLDALSALVVHIGRDVTIAAVGRDDDGGVGALATRRAEALRNALLARGVAATRVRMIDDDAASGEGRSHASVLRWVAAGPAHDGGAGASTSSSESTAPAAASGASPSHWNVLVQDITLARTLERWGAQAGYRVKWDAGRNFLIGAPDSVDGTFETALKTILGSAGIRQSDYPLEACIYANTPPLVRITRQGEQARECEAQ
jgi:outer membrane protein OmpA-like peptidoglycan-associated protein